MTDLDKMARELLAQWHLQKGLSEKVANDCRTGAINIPDIYWDLIRAVLLTAPPGHVLVPVEAGEKEIETMAYAIPASVPSIDAAKVIARRVRDILVTGSIRVHNE